MSASRLDAVYRSILITKFFTKGWGKPESLQRLFEFRKVVSNRDECFKLVEKDYPVTITKDQTFSDCRVLEGYFTSPLERYLPGIVPKVAQQAHFQALLPVQWPDKGCKPVCLHLAGTGDHFFWRRRNLMAKPLLKEAGIGGIILENPFYGLRKPTDQVRSSLHNVSDIIVMGGCLILESLVLFHWCERNGFGPLGVTGLSMGGHMASLAATNWPKPLVLVPCLSWSTASAVFLQGVMSQSINWDLLEDQYLSDGIYREKLSKMVTIVDEAFLAGKKFAQTYSHTVENTIETNTQDDAIKNNIKNDDIDVENNIQTNAQNGAIKKNIQSDDIDVENNLQKNVENDAIKNVLKNVDITYKESNGSEPESGTIDVSNNLTENKTKISKCDESFAHQQNLKDDLKLLFNDNKISPVLYGKLTSNDKFVLDVSDIEEINKMNEYKIKEVLLKYNVAEIRKVITDLQPDDNKQRDNTAEAPLVNTNDTNVIITPAITQKTNTEKSIVLKDTTIAKETNLTVKLKDKKSWNVADLTSDLMENLPFLKSSGRKIDINKIHWRDREALQFMRGIMDECTHLSNFSVPFDTSLIIAVCAKHDAYVPREDVGNLEEIWPGAEVRYVDAGHVSAYILHQSLFRSCIIEAFERSKKKWKDGRHID